MQKLLLINVVHYCICKNAATISDKQKRLQNRFSSIDFFLIYSLPRNNFEKEFTGKYIHRNNMFP